MRDRLVLTPSPEDLFSMQTHLEILPSEKASGIWESISQCFILKYLFLT